MSDYQLNGGYGHEPQPQPNEGEQPKGEAGQ